MIDPVLHPTEDNPAPGRFRVGAVESAKGIFIRTAMFMPKGRARGTVLILQGRAEFIEKYFELARHFVDKGLCVVTFDFRGQGGSTRSVRRSRKGHVGSLRDYDADLEAVIREIVLPDTQGPLYLLAHSPGALVALRAQALAPMRYKRVVLSSPLFGLGDFGLPQGLIAGLAGTLSLLGLGRAYVPGGGDTAFGTQPFAQNRVTTDRARYQRTVRQIEAAPQLGLGAPTIGWLNAVCRSMAEVHDRDFLDKVDRPMLILKASADRIVSPGAIEWVGRRLQRARILRFAGARHELLMERDGIRDEVLAAIDAYFDVAGVQEPARASMAA